MKAYLLRLVKDGIVNEGESSHPNKVSARGVGRGYTGSGRWHRAGNAHVSVSLVAVRRSAYVSKLETA